MKYFFDTEFIEGFHKPMFGKRRHHVDLISIGIVSEDGRTYSAISSEYDFKDASKWVQDNVIIPLYTYTIPGFERQFIYEDSFHKKVGKTNAQIAKEIFDFVNPPIVAAIAPEHNIMVLEDDSYVCQPDFYGYFADYDWVLLCSLYGTMMDLPKGFPMYCRDLKQIMDASVDLLLQNGSSVSMGTLTLQEKLRILKNMRGYPRQTREHSAIEDAKWNLSLYQFLTR